MPSKKTRKKSVELVAETASKIYATNIIEHKRRKKNKEEVHVAMPKDGSTVHKIKTRQNASSDRKSVKRKNSKSDELLNIEDNCELNDDYCKPDHAIKVKDKMKRTEKSKRKGKKEGNHENESLIEEVDSISVLSVITYGKDAKQTVLETSAYFEGNGKTKVTAKVSPNRKLDMEPEHQTLTSKIKHLKILPNQKSLQQDIESEEQDFEPVQPNFKSPEQIVRGKKGRNKTSKVKEGRKSMGTAEQYKIGEEVSATQERKGKSKPTKSKASMKRRSTDETCNDATTKKEKLSEKHEVTAVGMANVKKLKKDKPIPNARNRNKPLKIQDQKSGPALPIAMDNSDVTAVLLHMEGPGMSLVPMSEEAIDDDVLSDDDSCDDDDDDNDSNEEWEDVEDHVYKTPAKSQLPDNPVEITLEAPVIYKKRKKREFDWKAHVKRQMNKYNRNLLIDIHKVHLLCLMSRGLYMNKICRNEVLLAQAMSIIGTTRELNLTSVSTCAVSHMTRIVHCIMGKFKVQRQADGGVDMVTRLEAGFQTYSVFSTLQLALVYVILLRQLGYLTRLVMSLQPIPLKTSNRDTKSAKKDTSAQSSTEKPSTKAPETKKGGKSGKETNKGRKHAGASKSGTDGIKGTASKSLATEVKSKQLKTKNSTRRSCASKISPNVYKETHQESDDHSDDDFVPVDDISDENVSDFVPKNRHNRQRSGGKEQLKTEDVDKGSDEDFDKGKTKTLTRKLSGSKQKELVDAMLQVTCDEWVEVYLQSEKKWVCVDCATGKLNKPYEIEHTATQPVSYILGFTQDGTVKDVTARYASQWLTSTKKLQVDPDWWQDTLAPYKCADQQLTEQEDNDIQGHLIQRPLPTNMGAFKNHPLYVLRRHLLKFEAIYPDTAIPMGYIRGEPVYARECVHTLHSRENWLKEGRAVRIGEEPYKFVKSRPKWNKPKENPDALDLQLFGPWQTELYIPPPAVDGKVPRNAHGNVEMYLPSMLPGGTVHLQIPALNRVARKLGIDCAPAMVGWEQHSGFSHPMMDGWIVCEEFKDTLLAAWDEEQEIVKAREAEKREKRVLTNWRLLVRGLLIKERLKKMFDLEEEENKPSTSENPAEKTADVTQSWPLNRQTGKQMDQHTLCMVEKL